MPLDHDGGRILLASMRTGADNNGTWHRHATFFWVGRESHYLMYRQASPDDLGFDNDGSFHHYRMQDSDRGKALREVGNGGLGKREEDRAYGVVTDYLWQNE